MLTFMIYFVNNAFACAAHLCRTLAMIRCAQLEAAEAEVVRLKVELALAATATMPSNASISDAVKVPPSPLQVRPPAVPSRVSTFKPKRTDAAARRTSEAGCRQGQAMQRVRDPSPIKITKTEPSMLMSPSSYAECVSPSGRSKSAVRPRQSVRDLCRVLVL